jgi:hypothetical protein
MKVRNTLLALGLMAAMSPVATLSFAQTAAIKPATPIAASAPTAVPALVPYSGAAIAGDGKTFAAESGVTFQIYKDEVGGEALWTESQTVAIESTGHYQVQLGAASPNGLPGDLFASGEARWLEVQVAGEAPQPRVLLVSVPYALKAADAATLGGLPPSAFALARPVSEAVGAITPAIMPNVTSNVTTTGGTVGFVPEFSGTSSVIDSPIFVSASGQVGIGTIAPTATLTVDGTLAVDGASTLNGQLLFSPTATATVSAGFNSQPVKFNASAYNSSTNTVVSPRFQWQADVTGNNTSAPNGTLNLLASSGTPGIADTGFHFNTNGTLTFAPGQTFPGTGAGTITGVTAGTALTGGGTTGTVTLNVDTTKVPLLTSANTFAGTQTITGGDLSLAATTGTTVGVIDIGGIPFLHGYKSGNDNVFVGGAGNFTTTGTYNAGTGFDALTANTSGVANTADGTFSLISETSATANTAIGYDSLYHDTTGNDNAGLGYGALFYNSTGSDNTAVGTSAGPDSGSTGLSGSTAIGANAVVSQNNSLVLGQTTAGNPGASFVNVGIGTATPYSILEASTSAANALGPVLTLTNPGGGGGTAASVDFNTEPLPTDHSTYQPGARIEAIDNSENGDDLLFLTKNFNTGTTQPIMRLLSNGSVGLYTESPDGQLDVESTIETGIWSVGNDLGEGVAGFGGNSTSSDPGGSGGNFYGGTGLSSGASGDGIEAFVGSAEDSGPVGYAGYFGGNVHVTGALSVAGVKNFKIDDPLDPANKYLVHSSVESSEMMNIYSGNVTTDDLGLATVTLPSWFQAENGDFRYQLTVIGGRFAQAIVSKEIGNNQFSISTNATNVKVSWQVTAVRQDVYAKANPMVVEEIKPANERGFYEHPELYGQPANKQTAWGRNPQAMQKAKTAQEKRKLALAISAKTAIAQPKASLPASAVNRNFPHPAAPAIQPQTSGAQLKPISQVEIK